MDDGLMTARERTRDADRVPADARAASRSTTAAAAAASGGHAGGGGSAARAHAPHARDGQALRSFDPQIFFPALGVTALVVLATALDVETARAALFGLQDFIVEQFSWLFALTVTGLLVFSVWLGFSRYGTLRLGPPGTPPDYSLTAWLAMLFCTGMGIGLVFFGVAEPVLRFISPRVAEPRTAEAAREAMRLSIFHWGLHAWAIYTVLGLALAWAHFREGEPLSVRTALRPLLRRNTDRWPGKGIDVLAVLGTLFGLATSLGLGAAQINAGLGAVLGVPVDVTVQIVIIVVVTACALTSLVLGLDRGIRRLSVFNLWFAGLLLLFVLLAGPTAALLRGLPDHVGSYLQALPGLSLRTDPFRDLDWQKSWTVFYWAWWLSWAPFVGTFIARVSRGRTVREFVIGCLLVPSLLGVLWFGVFGGAALRLELAGQTGVAAAVQEDTALSIYALLAHLPFSGLTSVVAVLLVAVFFVTSSDSASYVVDMLTSGGHPNPPIWQRVFWGVLEGALAAALLVIGGLSALQAGAVSLGLPFCLVMAAVAWCLRRRLQSAMPAASVTGAGAPTRAPPQ